MSRRAKTESTSRIADGKEWRVILGDVEEACKELEPSSFDAVLCDPPYGISFMGKKWDIKVPQAPLWEQVLRVLKPGAPLVAFSATRTYHRMACAIEDGGFEIGDMFAWLYGQGWPKGLDLSKAMDKRLGSPRGYKEDLNLRAPDEQKTHDFGHSGKAYSTEPTTETGNAWKGYNTALKPACEPACLAFKPFEGTYADNVLRFGVGGLNVDASRVGAGGGTRELGFEGTKGNSVYGAMRKGTVEQLPGVGRYPSNVIVGPHDARCALAGTRAGTGVAKVMKATGPTVGGKTGWATAPREALSISPRPDEEVWDCHPECPCAMLDAQSGRSAATGKAGPRGTFKPVEPGESKYGARGAHEVIGYGDAGGASRFFYCPKASGKERGSLNDHETVKPMDLMRYLARMLLPPPFEGRAPRILVPFCGSGSEMLGCMLGGWTDVTGIERDPHNAEVARWRVENARHRAREVVIGGKK